MAVRDNQTLLGDNLILILLQMLMILLMIRIMSESNLIFTWKNSKIFATTPEASKYKEFAKLYCYI